MEFTPEQVESLFNGIIMRAFMVSVSCYVMAVAFRMKNAKKSFNFFFKPRFALAFVFLMGAILANNAGETLTAISYVGAAIFDSSRMMVRVIKRATKDIGDSLFVVRKEGTIKREIANQINERNADKLNKILKSL